MEIAINNLVVLKAGEPSGLLTVCHVTDKDVYFFDHSSAQKGDVRRPTAQELELKKRVDEFEKFDLNRVGFENK